MIILIVLLGFFLSLIIVSRIVFPPPKIQNAQLTGEYTSNRSNAEQMPSQQSVNYQDISTDSKSESIEAADSAAQEEWFRDFVGEQNVSIQFFGKVVDQYDSPVAGAKVKLSVREWRVGSLDVMGSEGRSVKYERETTTNGIFDLQEAKGDVLTVESIQKDGYELSARILRFIDCRKSTNYGSSNPKIYKMWKKGAHEPLISGEKLFGIIPDQRVYSLDLVEGKKVEGVGEGDLMVRIKRSPVVDPQEHYEWSCVIEGVQGGLLETEDEFPYLAPEEGYQSQYEMTFNPTSQDWTSLVKKQFYIWTRNGQVYGRIQIAINPVYDDKSALEMAYAINPGRSRNLEP